MSKEKKTLKRFTLNDFKGNAKTIESKKALEAITGGVADDCHPKFSRFSHTSTGPIHSLD